jgi:hypothetical protein
MQLIMAHAAVSRKVGRCLMDSYMIECCTIHVQANVLRSYNFMKSFYQGAKAALEAGLSDSIAANIVLPKLGN